VQSAMSHSEVFVRAILLSVWSATFSDRSGYGRLVHWLWKLQMHIQRLLNQPDRDGLIYSIFVFACAGAPIRNRRKCRLPKQSTVFELNKLGGQLGRALS
jgi:hypothetical protein